MLEMICGNRFFSCYLTLNMSSRCSGVHNIQVLYFFMSAFGTPLAFLFMTCRRCGVQSLHCLLTYVLKAEFKSRWGLFLGGWQPLGVSEFNVNVK